VIVIVQEGNILKTDRLLRCLKDRATIQEFEPLEDSALKTWVASEAASKGLKISHSALSRLVMFAGNDLWRLSNEIDKLAAWAQELEKMVSDDDINRLVTPKIETDIF